MKEWNRITKKIDLDQIEPEMAAAIHKHIESYNLGSILTDPLICIETRSVKAKKKLFGWGMPRQTTQTAVVTPHWLVICLQTDRPGAPGVLSVPLKDAVVEDMTVIPLYQKLGENGLHVTGIYTGRVGTQGNQRITSSLFLGDEIDAAEFKAVLMAAARGAREEG